MKKIMSLVLILLLSVSLPALAENSALSENNDLFSRIYNANTSDALQAAHESCIFHSTEKGMADIIIYTGKDYYVQESPDLLPGIRVRSSEYDYIALEDGSFQRLITLVTESDPWEFLDPQLGMEQIISSEEENGALVVTFKSSDNYADMYYPDAIETKAILVVDADSLEMKSFQWVAILPDGSEEVFYDATIEFDVDPIHQETIDAIEKHLYEEDHDTHTTTFIFDDDKPCKRTYSFETPVGDGCLIYILEDHGYRYKIDQERGVASNEALDNDAVYYMVRVESEG